MAYIQTINPGQARGKLRDAYREFRRDLVGRRPLPAGLVVPNIMCVFSLRPALLHAFGRFFLLSMWDGELARRSKEAIGVAVAQAVRCHY
jgi:Carboxymuconolactone decarboxylase family